MRVDVLLGFAAITLAGCVVGDDPAVARDEVINCSIVVRGCQHQRVMSSALPGDIVLGSFQSCPWGPVVGDWCHAALVTSAYPNFRTIEITGPGATVTEVSASAAWTTWTRPDRRVALLRPRVDSWRRQYAPGNARVFLGRPYAYLSTKTDFRSFYCSKLVWAAYYMQTYISAPGTPTPPPVDLDGNGGPAVFPQDLISTSDWIGSAAIQ